ncbi:MAG TPA: outer membrane protein assembly factor BamC [Gallionella sp.]|nr:outer membrane protein assembly factor BamC [Gallionella sp.]
MKILRIMISGAVLASLAGCSTLAADGKRIDYGAAAVKVPSLEVPPDLTAPAGDDRYKVPEGTTETATYSDYSKGGSQNSSGVLPQIQGVHIEHNNAERWLVVDQKAENVWPIVKAFWQDLGLTISSEDQAAGVMETAWAENRAKNPTGGSPVTVNEELNNAYEISERDQYLTRLERSKDGASTEVYITHRGLKEVKSPTAQKTQWVARARDPELEAIMLQRLMVRFGVNESNAAREVAAAASVPAAGAVAAVSPEAAAEPAGQASLRENSAGNTIIVVNDPFDRSWRRVGLAIEGAGLGVEDKDREKGIYYLRPVKLDRSWLEALEFWKSSVDTTSHYRVLVKDGGASCEVSLVDQEGASNKVSKQMLDAIYKNINKQ